MSVGMGFSSINNIGSVQNFNKFSWAWTVFQASWMKAGYALKDPGAAFWGQTMGNFECDLKTERFAQYTIF